MAGNSSNRYFERRARLKTAIVLSLGFVLLFHAFGVACQFIPVVGPFLSEGMNLGSPLFWLGLPAIKLAQIPLSSALFDALIAAPYPIAGWLIGYWAPITGAKAGRLVAALVLRFLLVWVLLEAFGLYWVFRMS